MQVGRIERAVLVLRGIEVLLDADLVHSTKSYQGIVQAVKRNLDRFHLGLCHHILEFIGAELEHEILRGIRTYRIDPHRESLPTLTLLPPYPAVQAKLSCSRFFLLLAGSQTELTGLFCCSYSAIEII